MAGYKTRLFEQKDSGLMDSEPEILDATFELDLERIMRCIARDPDAINSTDTMQNNAMHLCVAGGGSVRAKHIMEYLLDQGIDLHQENISGEDPLALAIYYNDEEACQLLEPVWHEQLNNRYPPDDPTRLSIVPSGNGPSGNKSGPK
jgi:ankyrin repeat protein